mgnify:CR=1 FL=1
MKTTFFFILGLLCVGITPAQNYPIDYLSADFHKGRRDEVRALMPENSVAVLFANPVHNRANDVDYVYHQDPNFYYLTGYKEPNAVLIVYKEMQQTASGVVYNEQLFVQKKDPRAEQWNGKRLGVAGAKELLGFEQAFNGEDFSATVIDFSSFDSVLFFDFQEDYRNSRDTADLYDLIEAFKEKANYPADFNATKQQLYTRIMSTSIENSANVAQTLGRYLNRSEELQQDALLSGFVTAENEDIRNEFRSKVAIALKKNNLNSFVLGEIMGRLRETKTPEEMVLLKKAIEISAVGQAEVMKAMHKNMSEMEVQGIHEYVYKKYGAEYEGYPSIVGAGNNGCILHYIENSKTTLGKDLVLMDLGAEYHGYTADVTRTIPANGKFSEAQKLIYDIVYNAQEAGIKASVVGAPFQAPNRAASAVVAEGLLQLGIISDVKEARTYFPHGTSHYLGLDVHDPGTYGDYKDQTVITVEPGIYIPESSDCDEKWWGIAVRIEDDILITNDGPVLLSGMAPRTTEAIEALMAQSSALDDFKLPSLK